MAEIFHLVYSSTAVGPVTKEGIEEILNVAREKNKDLDITGLLLYRNGFFIQLLEGNENRVNRVYDKIRRDPRHKDAMKLAEFHSESRLFEKWSMGSIQDEFENAEIAKKLEQLLKTPMGFKDNMKGQVIEVFRQVNR